MRSFHHIGYPRYNRDISETDIPLNPRSSSVNTATRLRSVTTLWMVFPLTIIRVRGKLALTCLYWVIREEGDRVSMGRRWWCLLFVLAETINSLPRIRASYHRPRTRCRATSLLLSTKVATCCRHEHPPHDIETKYKARTALRTPRVLTSSNLKKNIAHAPCGCSPPSDQAP